MYKGGCGKVGQNNDQNKPKNDRSCTKVVVGRWVKLTTRTSQRTIGHVQSTWPIVLWFVLVVNLTHLPTTTFVHDLSFFGLFWSLFWPTFLQPPLYMTYCSLACSGRYFDPPSHNPLCTWPIVLWFVLIVNLTHLPTTTFVHDLLFFGLLWSLIWVGRWVKLTTRTSQRTISHVQRWLWEGGSN
jgi:hypothetical protein